MKKYIFLLIWVIFTSTISAQAVYNTDFNAKDYFHKESLIEDDFYPEIQDEDFTEIISQFFPGKERPNYLSLNLHEEDWKDFMSHYYSDKRFEKELVV